MSTKPHTSKLTAEGAIRALIAGLLANFAPGDTFVLSGTTYTRDQLVAALQRYLDAVAATKAAQATYHGEVDAERAVLKDLRPLRKALKATLQGRYGDNRNKLEQFGLEPATPGDKTVAAKAQGIEKSKATREARHTMGSQQKKAVKGSVPQPATAQPAASVHQPAASGDQSAASATQSGSKS